MIHFTDLPFYIEGCIVGLVTSAVTAIGTVVAQASGVISPEIADKLGMQGILVCAIVAMAGFIGVILRFGSTTGIAVIKENTSSSREVAAALRDLNETNKRQNEYFEDITKASLNERLHGHLSASENFTPDPPTKNRRPR